MCLSHAPVTWLTWRVERGAGKFRGSRKDLSDPGPTLPPTPFLDATPPFMAAALPFMTEALLFMGGRCRLWGNDAVYGGYAAVH
eukprot:3941719-Rhodomonas_salina.2